MRSLVVLLASAGLTLLVFWFWREQVRGRVEPLPPLVAQLERLALGTTPEDLVATLVFSEPFREADPWDSAPKRRSAMAAWFGEPRELAFVEALSREPRTAAWRLAADSDSERARAEAEAAAALAWAKEKGVRLRAVAHGAAIVPVLRAGLAASGPGAPAYERLLGVGVGLADLKARDPGVFAALARGLPAGQWLGLYSDPSVVPRVLTLETILAGPEASAEPMAWPGGPWAGLVTELAARGAPSKKEAMPALTAAGMMSARQYRNKEGRTFTKMAGSLTVPRLEKEEIPPDPEAGARTGGSPMGPGSGELLPLGRTGWSLRRRPEFTGIPGTELNCAGTHVLFQEVSTFISIRCFRPSVFPEAGNPSAVCARHPQDLAALTFKGRKAFLCKSSAPGKPFADGAWHDEFELFAAPFLIDVSYSYPSREARQARLELFENTLEALEPPVR